MKYKRFLGLVLGLSLALPSQVTWAAELAEIIKRGKLIVAVKDDVPPLAFYDSQGNLQGLEIEIAKKIAEELLGDPNAIELVTVRNEERLRVVLEGKVDLAIAQISFTPSRLRLVNFSPFYYLDGTGIVTKDPQVEKLSDLKQASIAVLEGSSAIAQIRAELPQAVLIGVKSYQEALELLEAGGAVAFAGDNTVLAGWVQEYGGYRHLDTRLGAYPLGVIMPKGLAYQSLYTKVSKALESWHASGWLEARARHWGLPFVKKY